MKCGLNLCGLLILLIIPFACRNTDGNSVASSEPQVTSDKPNPTSHISQLISQLGSDDWSTREKAQRELERICLPDDLLLKEMAHSQDPEIRLRTVRILKVIEIKRHIRFSDSFMEKFPHTYHDWPAMDIKDKFDLLMKITTYDRINDRYVYRYANYVTNNDLAGVIGEVLSEGGAPLSTSQKGVIIAIAEGERNSSYYESDKDGQTRFPNVGWYTPVPETAPHLMKLLRDSEDNVCDGVVNALDGFKAKELIPELRKLLKEGNPTTRKFVLYAIWRLGWVTPERPDVKECIPEIIKMLADQDGDVRGYAAFALSALKVKEAIPKMTKLLKDGDSDAHYAAAQALYSLETEENTRQLLKQLLKSEYGDLRSYAAQTFARDNRKEAVPDIVPLLKDEDKKVRVWAVVALVELDAKVQIPPEMITGIDAVEYRNVAGSEDEESRIMNALQELGIVEEK